MTKEELVNKLDKVGIKGQWINQNEYGFSRIYEFAINEQIIQIEWYANYSTVMIGNAHFWFDNILLHSSYPMQGEWIEFSFRGEHPLHIKVNSKKIWKRGKAMENIRRWFENDQMNNGQNYEIDEYEGHLEARTDTVIFMVVEPHSGTRNRWLLRVSTRTAFDRWANSTAIEEFFDSDIELCNYLYEHQLDIYKDLIKYLSSEYDDIAEEY